MLRGEQRLTLQACPPSAVRHGSVVCSSTNRERAVRWGANWLGALALAGALWSVPTVALAQEEGADAAGEATSAPPSEVTTKVDAAKAQIDQLDYPAAQQTLFEVVQSGKATSAELAQAYFSLGVVEAALGNDVESTDSFYLALMIDPSLLFPEGGSPKIRERLNEARTERLFNDHYGTGQSTLDGILRATNLLLAGKTLVVLGTSQGGPGYTLAAEFNDQQHREGVLSMARESDPLEKTGVPPRADYANTAGSQFFFCLDYDRTQQLDRKYTAFGRVTAGVDAAKAIIAAPRNDQDRPNENQTIDKVEVKEVTAAENPYPAMQKLLQAK